MVKKLVFQQDRCKGCGLCVAVCPKQILCLDHEHLNAKGYNPVHITEPDTCISCAMCAKMCPDCVIEVYKPE